MTAGVVRGYVDYRYGQIHYRECGDGQPLVLLHQNPNSSVMYEAAYPLFAAAGFRAIGFDHPACGMSDPPPAPQSIEEYAELIMEAVDNLGLGQFDLLGHHTGAAIGCEMAIRGPGRVRRLVLSGAPVLDPADREQVQVWARPQPLSDDGSHLMRFWNQRLAATPGWTDLRAMARGVTQTLVAGKRFNWGFLAGMAYPMPARILELRVPTLLLTNEGEDMYRPTVRGHELRPDFPLIVMPDGTRDIVDERPQEFVEHVVTFLRQE